LTSMFPKELFSHQDRNLTPISIFTHINLPDY
jgi:hypothetical protein